jgi:serine acetyltransferase
MNVVVLAGIKIGAHAYVGAQQLVSHDVAPCQFLTPGYESRRYIFGRRWQGQMLPWVYNEQVTSTYPSRAQAELQRHAELVDVMREART